MCLSLLFHSRSLFRFLSANQSSLSRLSHLSHSFSLSLLKHYDRSHHNFAIKKIFQLFFISAFFQALAFAVVVVVVVFVFVVDGSSQQLVFKQFSQLEA